MKSPLASAVSRLALAALTTSALFCAPSARATTYDWTGASSANLSGTTGNWSPATVPTGTDVARWNAATYTNAPTANATQTIGELLFDAGNTAGVTFGAGASTITLNGISGVGIQLNSGSGAVSTGSAKFSIGADQIWLNNSANTLTVGGTITNASTTIARTLTVDGTGNTSLNGIISNNTATTTLTKAGSGTLTLAGANTFTGGLNVQQGTAKLSTSSAAAGAGLVTIGSSGNNAVLDLNGASRNINSIATAGTAANQKITNSAATAATLTINGATTSTFGGVIENGTGGSTTGVTVNNAGAILTLSGANTYTGTTTVTAGTLKLGAANTIVSGNALTTGASGVFDLNGNDQTLGTLTHAGTITNSSGTTKTLTFGSSSASTGAGSFTGAMNVIFNNANISPLSGSWSNTGNITINANNGNTLTLSGSINNTGTFTNSGNSTGAAVISGNIGANVGLITQNSAGSALTLSGTNTNAGGVTLTTGTLKLGSTTALGATASTLTIGAGTTLDSTVANLVLANNNAVNLNGSFTFTGTNALNLGTGAVTLAAPLTLTTTASTLTVGGTISGGTIFDITKAGAGTLVYTGNTTLSGTQVATISAGTETLSGVLSGSGAALTKAGAGTLTLSNTNTYTGATTVTAGTLTLSGANGSVASTAGITANSGTTLTFDSGTTSFAGTARATSTTLKGATLNVLGNSTANSNDTLTGALTIDAPLSSGVAVAAGANTVTITPNAATNAQLTAASLVRANNGAVFFRGTSLGANTIASATANTSNIVFTGTTPTLVGGGGAAGTKNISIIPWAVGATSASGAPSSFVTYDANGIRPLASGEYDTAIPAAASTNNVKLDAATPVTANGATTVNSLFLNNASSSATVLAGTSALTVTSGAIYADLSLGGNNNVLTVSKPIDFGTAEGVIGTLGTLNSKTLSFTGGIAGSGGLTIYDTNTVSSVQAGVGIGAATTYTGDTIIHGSLIANAANALPNFANSGRTGDVYVYGSFGINVANLRINGLFGNGNVEGPFATNRNLLVGDNNATSTFTGAITGNIGLIKIGTGTLTLTGTNSTYNVATAIQNGTLSVVTLNSVASGVGSTLGKPASAATGTIGLGSTTTTGTLKVVGTGETTDRVIDLAGTTGGGTLDQSGTGLLKFTNAFTATGNGLKTLTLTGSTAGTGEIAGAIVNSNSGATATSVTKAGTGTWTLSGTNTYTGVTTLTDGTLSVATIGNGGVAGNLGQASSAASNLVFNGGTLAYTGANATSDRAFTINTGKTATINTSNDLTLAGATGTATNGALTKSGAGTLTLSGTNTYTGATNVTGGKLLVNGSLANTTVTVDSGAILGGSGTIGGTTTINGSLNPGNSPGVLTFSAGLTLGSGSTTNMELNGLTRGSQYDGIDVTGGSLVYGGTLAINFGSSTVAGTTYDLFNLTSGSPSGSFSFVSIAGTYVTGLSNTSGVWTGSANGFDFTFTQSSGDLVVMASIIPEPSSFAAIAGALALTGVALRRRSRRAVVA